MQGLRCTRNGCTGTVEDGYCDICGLAAMPASLVSQKQSAPITQKDLPVTLGTGSSPLTNRSQGSRRTGSTSARSSRRQLGAGLISIPDLPSTEPEKAIISNPQVSENKRFCSNCNNPLRRERGFCSKCGQKFSFIPTLHPGDLVVEQYEVKGAIAYGGLGWIYLGFDKTLSRYVVLKGLLNTEDASSAAVALAERQFLAAVKHPNIVGIYNFVNHNSEGFIVMEYVGGKTLKEIRKSRAPLPVAEAIAYTHRILSAFAYLHSLGLVYCDFKPDNIMVEGGDVKLIDLGSVRRIDDPDGDIYGTVGYSAPEASEGPTVASDLYTIGRTLAVLLTDIRGFSKENLYKIPQPHEEPLFALQESLYRFLLTATATNPDDRFQSADEMADQLLGVLREVVAIATNIPRPSTSNLLSGDMLALTNSIDFEPIPADYQQLPVPILDSSDPGFNAVLNASAIADPVKRAVSLEVIAQQVPNSTEVWLRLVNTLIETNEHSQIEQILTTLKTKDPWDWRIFWYWGRALMAQSQFSEAQQAFDRVYSNLPGEIAPKLALGLAAEQAQNYSYAIKMYDLASRTDPSYVSATFGLARCLRTTGDRNGAVAALERVPPTSNMFTRSQIEIARTLINSDRSTPGTPELQAASAAIEALALEGIDRYRLTQQVLETALNLLTSQTLQPTADLTILGQPLQEIHLRKGLEKALRDMAHLANGNEKIRLVDQANRIRPRTWV
ncbi:MAG: protein kinase [Desmonostoc vinosum HA7617-LM4]|nr:protein kinase [Desmonostoc vinosum HA7617-LM4]